MYFVALGAAALAIGIAAWAGKQIAGLQTIAALVGLEAVAFVFAEAWEPRAPAAVTAMLIAILVLSLATTGTVAARAFAAKTPLAIAGAVCWTIWWVLEAIFLLWGIQTLFTEVPVAAAGFGIVPILAGAVGVLLVAIAVLAEAKQPGAIALVAVLAGFLVAWCLGEGALIYNADGALRPLRNAGYVGWHIVLAILLWRTAVGNLPPARIVTSRTASP